MDSSLGQALTLLVTSPGNLVYHLILAFSIVAALRPPFIYWRSSRHPAARRKVIGLSLLLIAQVVLYATGALAAQGIFDPHLVLPPLDRAVITFSLVWIIWLWGFQTRLPLVDAAAVAFSLLIVVFLGASYLYGPAPAGQPYNLTWSNFIWEIAAIYFALNGVLALILRRPSGWGAGLALFVLVLGGFAVQLLIPFPPADFLAAVRLAMLAAFPLLLALPIRQADPFETYQANFLDKPHPVTGERRRFSADLKTWQTFLGLAGETAPDQFCAAAARAVGQAVLADLCYFVSFLPTKDQVVLEGGYDMVRDEGVPGAVIDAARLPKVAQALKDGRPLVANVGAHAPSDLRSLGEVTHFADPGNLFLVPLVSDKETIGALLLLSPYSHRVWTKDEVAYLKPASTTLVQMMHQIRESAHYQQAHQSTQADLHTALLELDQLRGEHQDVVQRFILLRSQVSQDEATKQATPADIPQPVAPVEVNLAAGQQLRQAANTILGYAELLLGETMGGLAIPQRKFLEQIRETAVQANQTADQLFAGPSLPAAAPDNAVPGVNVEDVLQQAVAEVASQNVALTVDLPEPLPAVRSQSAALRAILRGILEDAALSGLSPAAVHVSAAVESLPGEATRVRLLVRAASEVFAASDLPAVLTASSASSAGGLDGSLLTARQAIEVFGGQVWIDQSESGWAVVTLLLDAQPG